ncbi:MAG: retroviral-like aspartic protease family protein [Firmicutes bacterium]|nr:retroviral-like aspartic protease family protein [Bacillota bacterium]
MKEPIVIDFNLDETGYGRVLFDIDVSTSNLRNFRDVKFKLDTGADMTTISITDLHNLGYTDEYLQSRPFSDTIVTIADGTKVKLQYLTNVSLKFKDREIQNTKLHFAFGTKMSNLFGNDILKMFHVNINRDKSLLTLTETAEPPQLADGEIAIQIYNLQGKT